MHASLHLSAGRSCVLQQHAGLHARAARHAALRLAGATCPPPPPHVPTPAGHDRPWGHGPSPHDTQLCLACLHACMQTLILFNSLMSGAYDAALAASSSSSLPASESSAVSTAAGTPSAGTPSASTSTSTGAGAAGSSAPAAGAVGAAVAGGASPAASAPYQQPPPAGVALGRRLRMMVQYLLDTHMCFNEVRTAPAAVRTQKTLCTPMHAPRASHANQHTHTYTYTHMLCDAMHVCVCVCMDRRGARVCACTLKQPHARVGHGGWAPPHAWMGVRAGRGCMTASEPAACISEKGSIDGLGMHGMHACMRGADGLPGPHVMGGHGASGGAGGRSRPCGRP